MWLTWPSKINNLLGQHNKHGLPHLTATTALHKIKHETVDVHQYRVF